MGAVAIELSQLSKVSARFAAASRLAARTLGGTPARLELQVPPLGPVTLTYAGIAVQGGATPALVLAVGRGGHAGRLCFDVRLARGLAAALVDRDEVPVLRRFGPIERGLFAGLVAVVLDRLGSDLEIGLAPPGTRGPVAGAVPVAIDVASPTASGQMVLELPPPALVGRTAGPEWALLAASLPVPARLELATTRLPGASLLALEPGDAVVFDGVVAAAIAERWPRAARLTVGDYGAPVVLGADPPAATAMGTLRANRPSSGSLRGEKQEETDMDGSRPSPETMAALAAAPIEVVAELGRVLLRGDEVLGLAPGAVIALPGLRSAAVALRVGDEIWAEGELVNVDGELGVRVTALTRRGRATPGV